MSSTETYHEGPPEIPQASSTPPPIPPQSSDPFPIDPRPVRPPFEKGLPQQIKVQSIMTIVFSGIYFILAMISASQTGGIWSVLIGLLILTLIIPAIGVLQQKEWGRISGTIMYGLAAFANMIFLGGSINTLAFSSREPLLAIIVLIIFLICIVSLFVYIFGIALLNLKRNRKYFN